MERERKTRKEILQGIESKLDFAESVPVAFDQGERMQIRKLVEKELRYIAPEYTYD